MEDTDNCNYLNKLTKIKNYLNKIINDIDKGDCNIRLLNELSDILSKYYKNYDSDSDTDEKSSSKSSEKVELDSKSSSLSNLSDNEEYFSEIIKNNNNKKEDTEKNVQKISSDKETVQMDPLLETFINGTQEGKKPRIVNPSYDTLKNINTFIKKSLVY